MRRGEKRGIYCKKRVGTKEDSTGIKLMLTYLTSDFERKELIVMERKREREREQLPKRQDESKGPEEMGEDGIQGSSSSHGRGAQGLDRHICKFSKWHCH